MARRQSYIHVHITAAIALILFFIAVPPLVSYFYKVYYFQPRLDRMDRELDSIQAKFLTDLQLLEATPLFPESAHQANAHSAIMGNIGWADIQNESVSSAETLKEFIGQNNLSTAKYSQFSKLELLHQFERYKDHFAGASPEEWVGALTHFDHWSFANTEFYRKRLEGMRSKTSLERIAVAATLPFPEYSLLKHYAVFYFLRQYRAGKPELGLQGIRQLAVLTQSSGTLVAQMTAVQLLQMENHLNGVFAVNPAAEFSRELLLAYRRVSWAWVGLFYFSSISDKVAAFERYMSPRNGACSAVFEAPVGTEAFADFFIPQWPLEMNLQPYRDVVQARLEKLQAHCGATAFAAFSEPLPPVQWWGYESRDIASISRMASPPRSPEAGFNWVRLPYVRQMVGMALTSIAAPHFFSQYQELKE